MLSESGNRHAGRVRVTADRLVSPAKEVRWQLRASMLRSGVAGKEAELPKKNFAQNPAENETQDLP
jgi:hypothetical protein